MADIELVIKTDENIYHRIISGFADEDDAILFENLFKNGILLPKGHGRLIDADAMIDGLQWAVEKEPTIIEADKEPNK